MSMEYGARQPEKSVTEAEGVMFAPSPVWERGRKRRGFSGRAAATSDTAGGVAPEPRSFSPGPAPAARANEAPVPADRPMTTTTTTTAGTDAGLVAPIGRRTETRKAASRRDPGPNGAMAAALAAGVVAVGALGAGAWYLMGEEDGVPELAPGAVSTEVAAAPILPPAIDQTTPAAVEPPLAEAAPPPAEAPRTLARREANPAPRARPAAAAPDASAAGVNASTTVALPEGPQPYNSLNPAAAPVNPPVLPIPPAAQASPAPVETPAAIPATPPISSEPSPSSEAPEATPPIS